MRKIVFFICISMALLFNYGCKHNEHEKTEQAVFEATHPIQRDTLIHNEYVAQIHSIQHIELRSQERGYLQNIYVDEGDFVKKGQLLFQIMPMIYQAEMQKAKAEAEFVEIEYFNTKRLSDSNIVSINELSLAKAKLDQANAALNLAQTHLNFTEIHAPFDGLIGRFHHVRLGSLIDEGELLSTLSDNSKLWVYFNVPEAEYLNFKGSMQSDSLPKVKLQMANGQLFNQLGVIETIEADFNNETGNIAFRATFKNPDNLLRHGETGNILMPVYYKDAIIIPQKATFEILDRKYVFVVDENSVVKSKEIKVVAELPHLYVVGKGLNVEDNILIEGLRKVKNNQKIKYTHKDFDKIAEELNHLHAE